MTSQPQMKMLLSALLTCTFVMAQSKSELQQKYGQPISETFLVRPGITVTATYAPDGSFVELLISPRIKQIVKSRVNTLKREAVDAVIDELVPKASRGKFVIAEFGDLTCLPDDDCSGSSENYQKVTIYYNSGSNHGIAYAVVQWNNNVP